MFNCQMDPNLIIDSHKLSKATDQLLGAILVICFPDNLHRQSCTCPIVPIQIMGPCPHLPLASCEELLLEQLCDAYGWFQESWAEHNGVATQTDSF